MEEIPFADLESCATCRFYQDNDCIIADEDYAYTEPWMWCEDWEINADINTLDDSEDELFFR